MYEQVDTGKKIFEVIDKADLIVSPVNITYNLWNSFSREEKLEKAKYFVSHPIKANKPIGKFHENL